jgi:hypothetical protein
MWVGVCKCQQMPILCILIIMIPKLKKEKMLYESFANKTNNKDSLVAFYDYFSFIEQESTDLCDHLNKPLVERNKNKEKLQNLYSEIIKNIEDFITDIESFIKKENLDDDFIFQDRLHDAKSLLDGNTHVFGGNRLDSITAEMSDITRRLQELGFEKELSKYVNKDKNGKLNYEDIIALEKKDQLKDELSVFDKKDARSLVGSFVRLLNLYAEIKKIENTGEIKININTFISDLGEKNKNNEYTKLMSGEITESKYFNRENYSADLERFHQSIIMNNQEEDIENTKEIFYLKGDDIYHYEVGLLDYKENGLKDPKYIKMFKNVINYMPSDKERIRVTEFEKLLPKNSRVGDVYRENLGGAGKSFHNFLKRNGVHNVHPKTKKPIIKVTKDYINFINKI